MEIPHLKAHVLPQEAFNALASPDGGIYLTEGVLRRHRMGEVSSEEVASIIAHELGHVALGHSKRRMGEMAAQNAARVGLVLVLGRLIPFIGGYVAVWIAGLLSALVTAKLSRKDEFEADAYAAALMRKAGLPVEAQARMFDKLAAMRPAGAPGADGPLAWLMGHPAPEERAAAVRRLAAQWEGAEG